MEIRSLKDLKNALKDVPDEILEDFGAGWNPEFLEDDVTLMVFCDESEFEEKWENAKKVAPHLEQVGDWIRNVGKVGHLIHEEEDYEGVGFEDMISSSDFPEDKPKSSSSLKTTLNRN